MSLQNSFVLASLAPLDLARRLDLGMCDGVYRLIGSVLEGVGHSFLLAFHPGPDELDVQTPVRRSVTHAGGVGGIGGIGKKRSSLLRKLNIYWIAMVVADFVQIPPSFCGRVRQHHLKRFAKSIGFSRMHTSLMNERCCFGNIADQDPV